MATTPNDLIVVLTGGSTNTNPDLSLGGDPSVQPLTGVLNNLFDNISEEEATAGRTDYRCLYVFNNSSADGMFNVKLYITSQTTGGSDITVGIAQTSEIQRITIGGSPSGGSFQVIYGDESETVEYDSDPTTWAENLETALNNMSLFDEVTVAPGGTFSTRTFVITFDGDGDFRFHDLLEVDDTNLTGTSVTSSVSRIVAGEPINSIPPQLEVETTLPNNVTFSSPTVSDPIIVGTLRAEEGFPLWVKRSTVVNSDPLANDGFSLRLSFSPIDV